MMEDRGSTETFSVEVWCGGGGGVIVVYLLELVGQ